MEEPFGLDINDVDVDKSVRRIDKHTAAIAGLWLGRPCVHYDVNPEATKEAQGGLNRMRSITDLKQQQSDMREKQEKCRRSKSCGTVAQTASPSASGKGSVSSRPGSGKVLEVEAEAI